MTSGGHGWSILFWLVVTSVGVVALIGIVAWELWRYRKQRAGEAFRET